MGTYQLIEHKGKQVVVNDLSASPTQEDAIATLEQTETFIKTRPPKSALLVTDVSNLRYDVHGVEAMKNFSAAVTPHLRASCVVGISGIKSVIYRSIIRITGRKIPMFEGRDQALDWLAGQ